MRMIIHDLQEEKFQKLVPTIDENTIVISDQGTIRHCIGCFGCWIKTPGVCVLKDPYQNLGALLGKCDQLIIISRCCYGSYSPFVCNILNRSISYMLPYFETINGETHHRLRYPKEIQLVVHFYGEEITPREQETATALVQANGVNFHSKPVQVFFYKSVDAIQEVV